LFPALPLLAVGVGCLWSWEKKWSIAPWLPVLFALSLSVALFTVFLPGQPLYLNARDGTGRLWEVLSSSWDVTPYLPSVVTGDVRSIAWALAGVGFVFAAVVLQVQRRVVRLPALALVLLVLAWVQDVTGVVQPRAQEGRWVTGFWRDLAERQPSRFLALPERERLGLPSVAERVPLRLTALRPDGDATRWWSLAYAIPAGSYVVRGVDAEGLSPCNDRNCFAIDGTRFDSAVALARFRVRARRLDDPPPRLHFDSVRGFAPVALRSLPLPDGRRLHGLDDEAYLDPKGFWVKRGSRAALALEPGGELELTNGGADNTVLIGSSSGVQRFELAPWARVTFSVPRGNGAALVTVESEGGFQPSELDPASADHRQLGVFVAEPAFDLRR
jgi:hypothetical protein